MHVQWWVLMVSSSIARHFIAGWCFHLWKFFQASVSTYVNILLQQCQLQTLEQALTLWNDYAWLWPQSMAASPGAVWDASLWNMAFAGLVSLTHHSWLGPNASIYHIMPQRSSQRQQRASQICYSWNHSPDVNACTAPSTLALLISSTKDYIAQEDALLCMPGLLSSI